MTTARGVVAAATGLVLAACATQTTPLSDQAPLAGGAVATDRITLAMVEPDDSVRPVVDFIDGAERTLDLAFYELDPSYRPVRAALRRAAARGVKVRVLLSRQYYPPGSANENPAAVRSLRRLGVAAQLSSPRYSYSHWKFLLRDARTPARQALVCDFNIAKSYFGTDPAYPKEGGTRGMAVLDTDPDDIAEISKAFDADWPPYSDQPAADRPNLVWAPSGRRYNPQGNAKAALGSLITGAEQTIDAYIQELPVPADLLGALVERAQAGVAVRVIGNQGGMDDAVARLQAAGAQVRYGPAAVDGSGRPLYIHSKSILVDAATERGVVFIGSENPFVNMSLGSERELGVLLTDPSSRSRVVATFDRDFATAEPA